MKKHAPRTHVRRTQAMKLIEPLEARLLLAAPTYTIVNLGALAGGSSAALGIDDAGQVVGVSTDSEGREHAILWEDGRMIDLGLLNNQYNSKATAINASGIVAGTVVNSDGVPEAALLSTSGTSGATLLGTLSGESSLAWAINGSDLVVGQASLSDGAENAVEFTPPASALSPTNVTDLGALGGFDSIAYGVNDSGEVVGVSKISDGLDNAFLYGPSSAVNPDSPAAATFSMLDLGTLGGDFSQAAAINSTGQIVGVATDGSGTELAFLYQNSAMTSLGVLPGGSSSSATAINASGEIVGSAIAADGEDHAFVWIDGVMTDLNPAPPQITSYIVAQANGINASGEIAAVGISDSGAETALLLIPTVLPDTTPPVAKLTSAPTLERGGRTNYQIQVTFTDNVAVDVSTLGDGNIVVRGPNRARQTMAATFVSAVPGSNSSKIVATYDVPAPNNSVWTSADNGVYSVTLEGRQVTDTSRNAIRGEVLGSFTVAIPALGPIVRSTEAILTAPHASAAQPAQPAAATAIFSTTEVPAAALFE